MKERILVSLDQGCFCENEVLPWYPWIQPARIEELAQLVNDIATRLLIPKRSLERGICP